MGKIKITMEVDPEWADEQHEMGLTEEGFERIDRALSPFGEDVQIEKDED